MDDQWLQFDDNNSEYLLLCPTCQFDHSHHGTVTEYRRGREDGKTTAHVGGLGFESHGNPSPRRDGISIYMDGECGHSWTFEIYQHKGKTLLRTNPEK